MKLPPNYVRTLLIRASLLIGFSSFLMLSLQAVQQPSTPTNQSSVSISPTKSPSTITLERTAPNTTTEQTPPTEPVQSPQIPSSSAPQAQQTPFESVVTGDSANDSVSASVNCLSNPCATPVTPQPDKPIHLSKVPNYHPCKVCNDPPVSTRQPDYIVCPTIYCAD